jgi:hypothetical protein
VEAISPPVTAASLSIPSKSACSIDTTPASVKILILKHYEDEIIEYRSFIHITCSGKLYISCLLMKQLIP